MDERDRQFCAMAIEEAKRSRSEDPRAHPKVGAVVVKEGVVLGRAHRGELGEGDHAEYTLLEKKLKDASLGRCDGVRDARALHRSEPPKGLLCKSPARAEGRTSRVWNDRSESSDSWRGNQEVTRGPRRDSNVPRRPSRASRRAQPRVHSGLRCKSHDFHGREGRKEAYAPLRAPSILGAMAHRFFTHTRGCCGSILHASLCASFRGWCRHGCGRVTWSRSACCIRPRSRLSDPDHLTARRCDG